MSEEAIVASAAAQLNLFGDLDTAPTRPPERITPDPESVRRRLHGLLETVRSAQTLPWSPRQALMWRTVFPQMANWLPADEAQGLRDFFRAEMERLESATPPI